MSIEEDLYSFIEAELINSSLGGNEIFRLSESISKGVKELVGATQEKLLLDLGIARQAQRTAEARETVLEEITADLYGQLATLHKERLDKIVDGKR